MEKVLVTGVSGYIGSHCAAELLKNGYSVKGSLRDLTKKNEVINGISKVIDPKKNLEFCELDLMEDKGWEDAMSDCDHVLHVASPFPMAEPKDKESVIQPAVQGTERALKHAKEAGIKKIVITSSLVSMVGGNKINHLNEKNWTDPEKDNISTYMKSKTLAEKVAWDWYKDQNDQKKLELTVINPGPVYGPTLTGNLEGSSMSFINQLMEGKMSALPNVQYVMSDVRDVAEIHVKSLSKPESNGRRLIVTTRESYSFINVAEILHLNGFIKKMPNKAPSLLLKTIGLFNNEVKGMLPFVDSKVTADTSLTEKIFNWKSRSLQEMIMDTAESIKLTKQL